MLWAELQWARPVPLGSTLQGPQVQPLRVLPQRLWPQWIPGLKELLQAPQPESPQRLAQVLQLVQRWDPSALVPTSLRRLP